MKTLIGLVLAAGMLVGCSDGPAESSGLGDAFASVDPANWEQVLEQARGATVEWIPCDDACPVDDWLTEVIAPAAAFWGVTLMPAEPDDTRWDLLVDKPATVALVPSELWLDGWADLLPNAAEGRFQGTDRVVIGDQVGLIHASADAAAGALVVANLLIDPALQP